MKQPALPPHVHVMCMHTICAGTYVYPTSGAECTPPMFRPRYLHTLPPSCAESWRCGKCADTYVRSLRVRLLGFAAMRSAPILELVVTTCCDRDVYWLGELYSYSGWTIPRRRAAHNISLPALLGRHARLTIYDKGGNSTSARRLLRQLRHAGMAHMASASVVAATSPPETVTLQAPRRHTGATFPQETHGLQQPMLAQTNTKYPGRQNRLPKRDACAATAQAPIPPTADWHPSTASFNRFPFNGFTFF